MQRSGAPTFGFWLIKPGVESEPLPLQGGELGLHHENYQQMATSLKLGLPRSLGKRVSLGSANRNIGFLKQNLTGASKERRGAREQLVLDSNQSSFPTRLCPAGALRGDRTPHSRSACAPLVEAKPHIGHSGASVLALGKHS